MELYETNEELACLVIIPAKETLFIAESLRFAIDQIAAKIYKEIHMI